MKRLFSITVLACALTLAIPMRQAPAWGLDPSEASMMGSALSSVAIISVPFMVSVWGYEESSYSSQESHGNANKKLPEVNMQVKSVDEDESGNPRVYLQVPEQPDHNITLTWPKDTQTPVDAFREGSLIRFQPSPQGSGWLLHDEGGATLAFVPTPVNAAVNHSALF